MFQHERIKGAIAAQAIKLIETAHERQTNNELIEVAIQQYSNVFGFYTIRRQVLRNIDHYLQKHHRTFLVNATRAQVIDACKAIIYNEV